MFQDRNIRAVSVIGPMGELLTLGTLPPARTTRWVARRKAEVVAAVDGGLLTIDEALTRYELSIEEFVSWRRAMEREGIPGLRVSSAQHYHNLRKHGHSSGNLTVIRPQFRRSAPVSELEVALDEADIDT
jgi:hypothetical protein